MAHPNPSPFECLPLLVLETICEYLDDEAYSRRDLFALSLASRRCCAAASLQRFCQLTLWIPNLSALEEAVGRFIAALRRGGHCGRVRRLKVLGGDPPFAFQNPPTGNRDIDAYVKAEDVEDEEHELERIRNSGAMHGAACTFFGVHPFCVASEPSEWIEDERDRPDAWQPLADLLHQLPGLQDFVWNGSLYMSPVILSAVHAGGVRLHMALFFLPSIIQDRDDPQPIDPDEYALVTSPSLVSIFYATQRVTEDGRINYIEEVVDRMVTGLAPNLAHVWTDELGTCDSFAAEETTRLGFPAWRGFFPKDFEVPKATETAKVSKVSEAETTTKRQLVHASPLRHLVFYGDVSSSMVCTWDLTNVQSLVVPWDSSLDDKLVGLCFRGQLQRLEMLMISSIDEELEKPGGPSFQLLAHCGRLRRLDIFGYIGDQTFDVIVRRHGSTLRNLLLSPFRDPVIANPVFLLSAADVDKLADHCPNLEELTFGIDRTRGDHREVAIYRALSRFPRLKRLRLHLRFSIGPDGDHWDEARDGKHPYIGLSDPEEIPLGDLREAFSNCAIDATLARAIFDTISDGGLGSLKYLELGIARKVVDPYGVGRNYAELIDVLRVLTRQWVCWRDAKDGIVVREMDKKVTTQAIARCIDLDKRWERSLRSNGVFKKAFNAEWSPVAGKWWNEWTSLPLSDA